MLVQLPAAIGEINKMAGWNKDGTRQRAVEIKVRNKVECMFANMFIEYQLTKLKIMCGGTLDL